MVLIFAVVYVPVAPFSAPFLVFETIFTVKVNAIRRKKEVGVKETK